MEIIFSEESKNQLLEFKLAGETNILKKIMALIESIKISPFEGIGKPEQLKYNFAGKWSRRITKEHRLIYEIIDSNTIKIYALKGHY